MEKEMYEFGAYRLDAGSRTLWHGTKLLKLTGKEFDTLFVLVRARGSVVSQDILLAEIWPRQPFIDKNSLNQQIKALRKKLGRTDVNQSYIETITNQGYFITVSVTSDSDSGKLAAPSSPERGSQPEPKDKVQAEEDRDSSAKPDPGGPPIDADVPGLHHATSATYDSLVAEDQQKSTWKRRLKGGIAILIAFAMLAVLFLMWPRAQTRFEIRQLTTNSAELSITAASISPDAKYLAYADETGVYVQLIETGETYALPPLAKGSTIFYLSWFPDSTALLVSISDPLTNSVSLWATSIVDHSSRKLADAGEASASPNGSRIAFVGRQGQEIWVSGPACENPRKLLVGNGAESFHDISWTGRQIVFGRVHVGAYRTDITIEVVNPETKRTSIVFSDPGLRSIYAAPNGRIFYSIQNPPPNQNTLDLWQIQIDERTARAMRRPRRIVGWPGSAIYFISASADGRSLAFLKGAYQADVYVGDIEDSGRRIERYRRLTLDDANDLPTAWTADSRAVLFHSDRNGKWKIFRQNLNERNADVIASDQDDDKGARLVPDGRSILYFSRPRYRMWTWAAPTRLMWTAFAQSQPKQLLSERGLYGVRCARSLVNQCVIGEHGLGQIVFYSLDLTQGKERELKRARVNLRSDQNDWDLSPDGSRIAVTLNSDSHDGHVKILSIGDNSTIDLVLKGQAGLQSMDWAADGKGLYISSRTGAGSDLLYVDLQGRSTVVRQQLGSFLTWGTPSPDGKHLAVLDWSAEGNIWMLNNF